VIDIFSVQDVSDMGDGEPLFANFMFEDWALMSLRFELHLLVRSFRHDVNDPERPGMHEDHVAFYYQRYYRKQLNAKFFGKDSLHELITLIRDTVAFKDSILGSTLAEEEQAAHDIFVKLTEEARRERTRRIDAGDESARLRFSVLATATEANKQGGPPGGPRVVPSSRSPGYQGGSGYQGAGYGSNYGGWGKGWQGGYGKGYNRGMTQRWNPDGWSGYGAKQTHWSKGM